MLLDLRRDLVESGNSGTSWDIGLKLWAYGMTSPTRFNWGDKAVATLTNIFMPQKLPGPLAGWTKYRTPPTFAKKPFRALWREGQKEEDGHNG